MVHLDVDLTGPDGYNKVHLEQFPRRQEECLSSFRPLPREGWLLLPSSHTSSHFPPDNGHRSALDFF
jgi:hypothetical protein